MDVGQAVRSHHHSRCLTSAPERLGLGKPSPPPSSAIAIPQTTRWRHSLHHSIDDGDGNCKM